MVEDEQEEANAHPQETMKSVLKPFGDAIDELAKGIVANQKAIKALANRKDESIIPPEIAGILEKTVPGLINALFKAFTTPDTPVAAAGKGIFNETLMAAYQKSIIRTWEANALIQEANLEQIKLNNQAIAKRLTDEY